HPGFRGRGCGTAVVSAVVEQGLREGRLLLYQTLEANRSAVQIALKLGYQQYGSHVAVRLKSETPSNAPVQGHDPARDPVPGPPIAHAIRHPRGVDRTH